MNKKGNFNNENNNNKKNRMKRIMNSPDISQEKRLKQNHNKHQQIFQLHIYIIFHSIFNHQI